MSENAENVTLEVVDDIDQLPLAVGVDRFERHRLAASVHVGLEVLEPRGRPQDVEALGHRELPGGDIELTGASLEGVQDHAVLGLLSLRIEVHPELDDVVHHLFTDRVVVHLEADL